MGITLTVNIKNCQECRHVGHSGSFTKGGSRRICSHSDACKDRKSFAEFKGEYPSYAKEYDGDWKYHWFNRIVSKNKIPTWCPLKNGSKY